MERHAGEHPELAYRRGYQQGVTHVLLVLEKAGALPPELRAALSGKSCCLALSERRPQEVAPAHSGRRRARTQYRSRKGGATGRLNSSAGDLAKMVGPVRIEAPARTEPRRRAFRSSEISNVCGCQRGWRAV
jgi:hypothetical protein